MAELLAHKDPGNFKTLPLYVEGTADGLSYSGLGSPLNFSQMLELRRPVQAANAWHFALELANLGVSVRLTLAWQDRDHWLLVRQQRRDRNDTVLKLISGYVPAHEVSLPLLTALNEVAEECLIENGNTWLSGRYADTWLPTPYPLNYCRDAHFSLTPLSGAALPVQCGDLPLLERPRAYVHLPTASLQLVYDMRLELPQSCHRPSLFHVDEHLEHGQLLVRLERSRPDIYLLPLHNDYPTGELLTLRQGKLHPASTSDIWMSEGFARQDGWLVRDERIRWQDWLNSL